MGPIGRAPGNDEFCARPYAAFGPRAWGRGFLGPRGKSFEVAGRWARERRGPVCGQRI